MIPDDANIRNEINRLEQEINEVAITHSIKERSDVNIIDVLSANCDNIISLDNSTKSIVNAMVSQQNRIEEMDEAIKKLRVFNTLLAVSFVIVSIIFIAK